ncbi:hypothetical protein [Aeoliella sp.]|uniref:hypothetical protein n=1 Tax=Aeoliella sp. TaxID=2795800 RepID=UPI003CCC3AB8
MTAIQEWKQAVDAKQASGMSLAEATREVTSEKPELHERYLAEQTELNLRRKTTPPFTS